MSKGNFNYFSGHPEVEKEKDEDNNNMIIITTGNVAEIPICNHEYTHTLFLRKEYPLYRTLSIQMTKNGLLVVGEEFIAISSNKSDPTTMMMTG